MKTRLAKVGNAAAHFGFRISAKTDAVIARAPKAIVWTVLVAVIISVGAVGFFWSQARLDDQLTDRSRAALASLRNDIPRLLTYRATGIDADFDKKYALLTGKFKGDFEELSRGTIIPSAKERNLETTAKVAESGVISAPSSDIVVVLMFINQTTTSKDDPTPKLDGSRIKVTAQLVDGSWKISALQPV